MNYTLDNLDSFGVWFLNGPDNYANYNFVREVSAARLWLCYGLGYGALTKRRTGSSVCASGEGHRARGTFRVRGRADRQREAGRALAQDPKGPLRHRPHQHTGSQDLPPSLTLGASAIDQTSAAPRSTAKKWPSTSPATTPVSDLASVGACVHGLINDSLQIKCGADE